MADPTTLWLVIGVISGLAGAIIARHLFGLRMPQRRPGPPPPPASRQERRARERQSGKRD